MYTNLIPKNTILTGLLLILILLAVCIVPPHYFFQNVPLATRFCVSRLLFWLSLFLIWLYAVKVEKQPLLLWPESKRGVVFYIVSVIGIILCIFIGAAIISLVIHHFHWDEHSKALDSLMNFSMPLKLLTVVTAAVVEEFIFRGYLMSRLQLLFKNNYMPVVISSLVFGLAHMGFGTVVNMVIPAFIGLVFALHYQKYRNLKVLILCHFLIDFFALILQHG